MFQDEIPCATEIYIISFSRFENSQLSIPLKNLQEDHSSCKPERVYEIVPVSDGFMFFDYGLAHAPETLWNGAELRVMHAGLFDVYTMYTHDDNITGFAI